MTTGVCSNPNKDNGVSCNDGDACTTKDTCKSGGCVGGPAPDCNDGNVCTNDPCVSQSGCSHPAAANGKSCNDGSACTKVDTCKSGVCKGGSPVVCTPLDACHKAGVCNPANGSCPNPNQADGTGCNDGLSCTNNDVCKAGKCAGSSTCGVCKICDPLTKKCGLLCPDPCDYCDKNVCIDGC